MRASPGQVVPRPSAKGPDWGLTVVPTIRSRATLVRAGTPRLSLLSPGPALVCPNSTHDPKPRPSDTGSCTPDIWPRALAPEQHQRYRNSARACNKFRCGIPVDQTSCSGSPAVTRRRCSDKRLFRDICFREVIPSGHQINPAARFLVSASRAGAGTESELFPDLYSRYLHRHQPVASHMCSLSNRPVWKTTAQCRQRWTDGPPGTQF
jgi:hypothetical protein